MRYLHSVPAPLSLPKRVTCYIDLKSPHSFLALSPTMTLERDYHCVLDWRPFELSYVELGVATPESLKDMRRVAPSAAGDRKARMYYATAREYGKLQGLTIRGPATLLDSKRANRVMLLARREGLALPFARAVYSAGWPSGFRDYDLTDERVLSSTLAAVGASPGVVGEVPGFIAAGGAGEAESLDVEREAKEAGVVGVPHYVVDHEGREKGLYGREHLALIRGWLHDQGLARREDVIRDISHAYRLQ